MLALVGSGEYLPPMEAVDLFLLAQLDGDAHVACLPTAAGQEGLARVNYWSTLGVDYFTRLGATAHAVPVIDRATADDQTLVEQIRAANFVYLSGGNPFYLYETLNGSQAWAAILQILRKGGVVAGCSAGAMVMGEKIPNLPRWRSAFKLLPGAAIIPHYDEIPTVLLRILKTLSAPRATLFGIDGNTALIVDSGMLQACPGTFRACPGTFRACPGAFEVIGSGSVTLWRGLSCRRYSNGQRIIWS